MSEPTEKFAERLSRAMKSYGVSPSQMASRTGLDITAVSHFTSGRREPSLANSARILQALPNVDARWLITGVY